MNGVVSAKAPMVLDPALRRGAVAATAWLLAALAVAMTVSAIVLAVWNQLGILRALQEFLISNIAIGVSLSAVGTLIALRRPGLSLGWYMSVTAIVCLVPPLAGQYARFGLAAADGAAAGAAHSAWIATFSWPIGYAAVLVGLPLLYPDGRLTSRTSTSVAWAAATGTALMVVGAALSPGSSGNLPDIPNPFPLEPQWLGVLQPAGSILLLACLLAAIWLLFVKYRHSDSRARIQIRAFLVVAAMLMIGEFGVPPAAILLSGSAPDSLTSVLETLLGPALAATIGVAVLRHHLHGIDVIVNRTVVYLVMTVLVAGAYVLLVWYFAAALGIAGTLPALAVTIVVAVLFHPGMQAVQRAVNRIFYGQRGDPYRLLTRLGERLEESRTTESVLDAVASTVREGLRLPYVEVTAIPDNGSHQRAESGATGVTAVTVPLVFGAARVGELSAASRQPGVELSRTDRRVLADYARQAGAAVYAVRLAGELTGARARLVRAQETERRRLRRELHDGLGADLGSQAITLDVVRRFVHTDPGRAEEMLVDLRKQVQEAVLELRRIVNDLRPAVLDNHGLAAAVTELVHRYDSDALSTQVNVDLPTDLPAALEVAVLRIVGEAIANAKRHSAADRCVVSVNISDDGSALVAAISDSGRGMPAYPGRGVGLSSMRERASELGGTLTIGPGDDAGTTVRARIPLVGGEHD